jgi:hypothetical protein
MRRWIMSFTTAGFIFSTEEESNYAAAEKGRGGVDSRYRNGGGPGCTSLDVAEAAIGFSRRVAATTRQQLALKRREKLSPIALS